MENQLLVMGHFLVFVLCVCTSRLGLWMNGLFHPERKQTDKEMEEAFGSDWKEGTEGWVMIIPFFWSIPHFIVFEIIYWSAVYATNFDW